MSSQWNRRYHGSGPATSVLEVDCIVMGTVTYHLGPSGSEIAPWQWQVAWGFRHLTGKAATEEEGRQFVEEKIQRLYEKFSQQWRDAHSTKAARKQK